MYIFRLTHQTHSTQRIQAQIDESTQPSARAARLMHGQNGCDGENVNDLVKEKQMMDQVLFKR